MNKKIHSLALLVNLGIYGVALPAMADDKPPPPRSTKTRW
jgi:ferric enterobactin receptor